MNEEGRWYEKYVLFLLFVELGKAGFDEGRGDVVAGALQLE
jgi:hypothetical protein